jgi:SAM-dependent methyltransferase
MEDYLNVEYSVDVKPFTDYPVKLASFLMEQFRIAPDMSLLEVGSGRAEILKHFNQKGVKTFALDSARSASTYARESGSPFELHEINSTSTFNPFNGKKFDFIFSKSFIEHLHNPESYALQALQALKPGGKFISLTPDWESNMKIFYDDITHVKPFTRVSMKQFLELTGYVEIQVFRFHQLPSTWRHRHMYFLARLSSQFAHPRVKNKWFRWSRELMIASIGTKPE